MGRHLGADPPTSPGPSPGPSRARRAAGRRAAHRAARARRSTSRAATAAAVVALVAGAALTAVAVQPGPGATAAASGRAAGRTGSAGVVGAVAAASTAPPAVVAAEQAVPAPAQAASAVPEPTRVVVPALGVDSALVRLGVDARGALEVPRDFGTAGWFTQGPAPGAQGPAVIAGHLDSKDGPGVFAGLARLRVGDRVQVRRADGSVVAFAVTGSRLVAKTAFPTAEVYGSVAGPELRLITCGGAFDHRTGHYVDNVIVFAREV